MPPTGNKEDQVCSSNWSVTYWFGTENSPSKEKVDEYIERARQQGYIINGQIEKAPTTGNLHYQLQVKGPWERKSALKKLLPTAHIEKTKKDIALKQYVKKEDTRVAPMLDADDKYPTANKLWELIFREYDQLHNKHGWEHDCDGSDLPEVQLYYESDQKALEADPLAFFDKMMARLIRRGYYVDVLACNPAIRSFWKKFWRDVLYRTRETVRQTDRQNELISQTVDIPTIDAADEEESCPPAAETVCSADSDGDEEGASGASEGRDQSSSSEADADDDW